MAEKFAFSLTDEEKVYLKDLVLISIRRRLDGECDEIPEPPTDKLRELFGVFVTLKIGGHLRGCIGHVVGDQPVYNAVYCMAQCAAFEDPRFMPLSEAEYEDLEIEISILSPIEPCPDLNKIEVGRHGLVVSRGPYSGLLLPQVATENGWNREEFLAHTCQKAGLPMDVWKQEGTRVLWFEAEVF